MNKKQIFGLLIVVVILILVSLRDILNEDSDTNLQNDKFKQQHSLFNTYCIKCHSDNNIYGAPSINEPNEWVYIYSNIDSALMKLTLGSGAMPPKGGCKNCTDDDLLKILEYIKYSIIP
tara:strand:+ start:893 stop:1249 length:357 start_codon:yes stop_codon:yes gene_type:complete